MRACAGAQRPTSERDSCPPPSHAACNLSRPHATAGWKKGAPERVRNVQKNYAYPIDRLRSAAADRGLIEPVDNERAPGIALAVIGRRNPLAAAEPRTVHVR